VTPARCWSGTAPVERGESRAFPVRDKVDEVEHRRPGAERAVGLLPCPKPR
jgi:hypothetical protein